MQKFSFSEKRNVLIPNQKVYKEFYDKDGKPLSGDGLIHAMAAMADKWEKQTHTPVPIPEQEFVAWIKQASKLLKEGKTSEEIFKQTIAGGLV